MFISGRAVKYPAEFIPVGCAKRRLPGRAIASVEHESLDGLLRTALRGHAVYRSFRRVLRGGGQRVSFFRDKNRKERET